MARLLPLLLCLVMTILFAGCATDTAPPSSDPTMEDESMDDPNPGSAPVSPVEAYLRTAVCSGTVDAGAGVQGNLQMGIYCPFAEAARGDLSGHGAALVEVRWPDAMPTQTRFNLFLLSDACNFTSSGGSCNLDFHGSGDPAFRYEVPTGILRADGDDDLRVYVSFDGPAVQQRVDVALTLVPAGGVLPDGHSALPA